LLLDDLPVEYRQSHAELLQFIDGHLERTSFVVVADACDGTARSYTCSADIRRVDLFATSIGAASGLLLQSRPSFSALFQANLTTLAVADCS
jgi:hypothetical protein